MSPRLLSALLALLLACPAVAAPDQPDPQEQRIGAAFVIAFGRAPDAAEMAQWKGADKFSVQDLVAKLREQIRSEPELQRAVAAKAWLDAFGRAPERDAAAQDAIYFDLMEQHVAQLAKRGPDYEQVLNRAYQLLLKRPAYDVELDYWTERDVLPFVLLVGAIEGWGRRNAPGLMATTGTPAISINSDYLTTVRLSPVIADEARIAAGMRPVRDPNVTFSAARNIVAPGAENVVSVGWIHFAAAGGPRMSSGPVRG